MKIKVRYIVWGVVLAISIVLTLMEQEANAPKPLKQVIEGYISPEFEVENEDAEGNINHSELGKKYTLKVSNRKPDASCFTITTDVEELVSDDYQVIGQTPLIVVMKKEEDRIKKYIKNGLLNCSGELEMEKNDKIEINFQEVMEAVINDKTWSQFGGKNEPIKIFYPKLTTVEGRIFQQFLLITANDGIYPTQEERAVCEKQVKQFLEKSNVQGVDVTKRLTGVDDLKNDLYITFENNVLQVEGDEYEENFYISYPTETVEKQVYFQSTAEAGKEIQKVLAKNSGPFGCYSNLNFLVCYVSRYRYEGRSNIKEYRNHVNGIHDKVNFKDAYNVIDIPIDFLKESK